MASELSGLVSEVLASPLGDVIASVGEGVAAAQRALDEASVAQTLEIYSEGGEELVQMLREIGYRPTFYALPETVGEVHVSMRLSSVASASAGPAGSAAPPNSPALPASRFGALQAAPRVRTYVTPVDAGFANRFNFDASASAKLTFKIVPVPPMAGVEDMRVVPDLVGRTAGVAREVLAALDLEGKIVDQKGNAAVVADTAVVSRMEPAPRGLVRLGATITLTAK